MFRRKWIRERNKEWAGTTDGDPKSKWIWWDHIDHASFSCKCSAGERDGFVSPWALSAPVLPLFDTPRLPLGGQHKAQRCPSHPQASLTPGPCCETNARFVEALDRGHVPVCCSTRGPHQRLIHYMLLLPYQLNGLSLPSALQIHCFFPSISVDPLISQPAICFTIWCQEAIFQKVLVDRIIRSWFRRHTDHH